MDRINNIVLAVFFVWITAMISTELQAHHGATHSGTQSVQVRK